MTPRTPLIFSLLLLLLSCGVPPTEAKPYEGNETASWARQIREGYPSPDSHILGLLEESNRVTLVDFPGARGGVDLMKYLIPLLHSRGVTSLDLWFIPRDRMAQANAMMEASRFFPASVADMLGEVSYLHHYEEYRELLRYLYDFNRNLDEGEPLMQFVDGTSLAQEIPLVRLSDRPDAESSSQLLIQSPGLFRYLEERGLGEIKEAYRQMAQNLRPGEELFVMPSGSEGLVPLPSEISLIMLGTPGTIPLCTPLEGGITHQNALLAQKDFSRKVPQAPRIAAPLLRRAQRVYLKELED